MDTAGTRPAFVDKAVVAIDHGIDVATALERPDLRDRLEQTRRRLEVPEVTVVVAGEFKQGKSTLVNALLNMDICPVDDDVSTVVPTIVRHGDPTSAAALTAPESHDDAGVDIGDHEADPVPVRVELGMDEVGDYAAEYGNPGNVKGISAVEILLPRQLLEAGLVVVDTPGVGGLQSVHGAATEALLSSADVVLFVSDASQELTANELGFLAQARKACPNVACIVTKVDLYLEWRRIVELNRAHLERAAETLEVFPVSSMLRQRATAQGSRDLNEESGYTELVGWLRSRVLAQRQRLAVRAAGADLADVAAQLGSPLRAELSILDDPEHAERTVADLTHRKERAEQLLTRTARWHQLLTDGSQDMASDIDHDLRRRMRAVTAEANRRIDEADPAAIWDEFAVWLEQQVAAAVNENNTLLVERTSELAERVGSLFAEDGEGLVVAPDVAAPTESALPELVVDLDNQRSGAVGTALVAMRGSYSGVLMFGLVAQLAGLALLNPLTAVVGLGLGRRALSEEKKRNRTVSQQKAKNAVGKYIDQASFLAGKDSKDLVRRVQRELRDTYRERAKEVETSTKGALAAAKAAASKTQAEAASARDDLTRKVRNVERLEKNAHVLIALPVEGMG